MNERLPDGSWLVENNPLRGVKLPKEEDPRRPVTTYDRAEFDKRGRNRVVPIPEALAEELRGFQSEVCNRW